MNNLFDPWLLAGILLVIVSVPVFFRGKSGGVFLLIVGSLFLRICAAQLSPFLHMWDEQFHALVAKNMSENILYPYLLPDIEPYNSLNSWTIGHVWLHKQPFFLWLMALSIKLFGATEFAVRLPSILLSTVSVWALFRLGKNLCSERIGFLAAFLVSLSYVQLKLVSGLETTDHNDLVFMSLITISFWLLSEYVVRPSLKWAIWMGVVVGCAVLTKWLTGILVFGPWFLWLVINKKPISFWKHFLFASLIVVLVVLPWQWYASSQFTEVYLHEMEYNRRHVFEVIEGHDGGALFHLEQLSYLYVDWDYRFILGVLVFASGIFIFRFGHRQAFLLAGLPIVVVFVFFTLVATKMPLFTFMVSGLVWICFAVVVDFILNRIEGLPLSKWIVLPVMTLLVWFLGWHFFRFNETINDHDIQLNRDWSYHVLKRTERQGIEELKDTFDATDSRFLIFNTRPYSHPAFTFYSGIPAYDFIPEKHDVERFMAQGYQVILLRTDSLPEELVTLEGVILYDFPYWN
jgi:4-amino-4-deoxy-L-arabinose transferase-like glycosyltransferase